MLYFDKWVLRWADTDRFSHTVEIMNAMLIKAALVSTKRPIWTKSSQFGSFLLVSKHQSHSGVHKIKWTETYKKRWSQFTYCDTIGQSVTVNFVKFSTCRCCIGKVGIFRIHNNHCLFCVTQSERTRPEIIRQQSSDRNTVIINIDMPLSYAKSFFYNSIIYNHI